MNTKQKILIPCLLAILLGSTGTAAAQAGAHSGLQTVQPAVLVDYAYFLGDSTDMVRLEVYYKIFNFALAFQPQGEQYVADYTVNVAIDDRDDNPIDLFTTDKRVVVATEEKARSRFDFRTSQANFQLPPDKYRLKFTLSDANSDEVFNKDIDIKLEDLDRDYPTFSTIEFARHVEGSDSDDHVFSKGNLKVIPSVSRDYSGEEGSRLLYYLELYRGEGESTKVVVETIIRSYTSGMVYRDTLTTILAHPVERQLREISSAEFPPGDYDVEIFLRGRRNKKLDFQRAPFSILWSQLALLKHDYKTALAQLELIAEPGEIKKMKELETLTDRIKAFNDFWLARDPSAGTPVNEVKNEFYRRVNYANVKFRHLRREGWRSDRGRVYIKHGEPDQIDDYPMSLSYLPYQIWHYYRRGQYLRFLFVDEDLDGDYRIQFPYDGKGQSPDF